MDRTIPSPRYRSRRLIAAVALAVVLVAGAVGAALYLGRPADPGVAVASPTASPTPSPPPTPTASPTRQPSPSPSSAPIGPDPVLGSDGRLTVLLLGSDYRPSHPGNRTDAIMVVSVDPNTGAVAVASIPRDTVGFPTSSRQTFRAKINGLYQSMIAQIGKAKAGREMKRIIGEGIGVEIDSYAVIGFEGVRQLVNAVGGVDVVLSKSVSDPYYWVTPRSRGVFFPAGRNHLSGDQALIFARTRRGDGDFERARRQQLLVAGAAEAVRERGLANLPKLLAIAGRFVYTDLPIKSAPLLFEIVSRAKLGDAQKVVFGTTKWATGPAGGSFSLRLPVVRAWTAQWMAPVAPPAPAPRTTPVPPNGVQ